MTKLTPKEATDLANDTLDFLFNRIKDKKQKVNFEDMAVVWAGLAYWMVDQMITLKGRECKETFEKTLRSFFDKAMSDV